MAKKYKHAPPKKVYFLDYPSTQMNVLWQDLGMTVASTFKEADILVYTGGADINPVLYGQTPHHLTRATNPKRDKLEAASYFANEKTKFKVGICRGAQLLNALNGGNMIQHDLSGQHTKPHGLIVWDYPRFTEITQLDRGVASTHHQMMLPPPHNKVDRRVLAVAYKPNRSAGSSINTSIVGNCNLKQFGSSHSDVVSFGRIMQYCKSPDFNPYIEDLEAVYYPETGSLCVQGHPEYPESSDHFRSIFKDWVFDNYKTFHQNLNNNKE